MRKGIGLILFGLILGALGIINAYHPYDPEHPNRWLYVVEVLVDWVPKLVIGGFIGYFITLIKYDQYRIMLRVYQDGEFANAIKEYYKAVECSGWDRAEEVANIYRNMFGDDFYFAKELFEPQIQERMEEKAKKYYKLN